MIFCDEYSSVMKTVLIIRSLSFNALARTLSFTTLEDGRGHFNELRSRIDKNIIVI